MTQPRRVAEEPQLCAAFVDGMMQGLKARSRSRRSDKGILKQVPEMALGPRRASRSASAPVSGLCHARDVIKTNGMGYMEPKDYESMTDLVMKYLAKEGDQRPEVAQMMTDQFVGDQSRRRRSGTRYRRTRRSSAPI